LIRKGETLQKTHAASVQQHADEPRHAVQFPENELDFTPAQDHRQSHRHMCFWHAPKPNKRAVDHVPIQKLKRRECLRLRRGGQLAIHREMREEREDFPLAHVPRMPQALVPHEPVRPLNVRLLGAPAEMSKTQFRT
jgi:hypothetical protein